MKIKLEKAHIEDATGMIEVAFSIVASYLKDEDHILGDAHLREIDDFLIKLGWVYREIGLAYCQILAQTSGDDGNHKENTHFM